MTQETFEARTTENPWRSFVRWSGRVKLGNKLALVLFSVAVMAGVATYAALTHDAPFGEPKTLVRLLTLDLVVLLGLVGTIAPGIISLWAKRRQGAAGAKLHVKFVTWFSLLAIVPAIFVAAFSVGFFYLGVESWFSDQVRTAVAESVVVSNGYLEEHRKSIRGDIQAMAADLAILPMGTPEFNRTFQAEIFTRNLSDAVIFDGATGRALAVSGFVFAFGWTPPPQTAIDAARRGGIEVMSTPDQDNVAALVKLYGDVILYVSRRVDPLVLEHTKTAKAAAERYSEAERARSSLQVTVALAFGVVTLLLLLIAVSRGLHFANQLVKPMSELIEAAERVRAGDLSTRVREPDAADEVSILSRTFNRMTDQLSSQRSELIEANRQLDTRRRFTETVLAGVTAGVLGLDLDRRVTLANKSATEFLGVDVSNLVGSTLSEILPEIMPMLSQLTPQQPRLAQSQLELRRPGLPHRTLLVRITAEQQGSQVRGYVVTFDDITELMQAQRKAAWADVARRIAHEIKNPLTPIQLAAERLKRKYLKEIHSDPETFKACTDTIVRQVGDIGRMVDEFSAFARMPTPQMRPESMGELVDQAVFLQRQARSGIRFKVHLPEETVFTDCDRRQMTQALTNLLQNAVDAIEGRVAPEGTSLPAGSIEVTLSTEDGKAVIAVADNGRGLPVVERDRLTEPYVTTRTKGTGLGLAIVKKIMEDHGGTIEMHDHPNGGARVVLIVPTWHADGVTDTSPPRTSTQSRYGA